MRPKLVLPFAALLALTACNDRQASKTEIAARAPIPAASTAACPPQPAPACPPAAGKFPAKASGAVSGHRARGAKARRQIAHRRAAERAGPYGYRREAEVVDHPPLNPYFGSEHYAHREAPRWRPHDEPRPGPRYSEREESYRREGAPYGEDRYKDEGYREDRYGGDRYGERRYSEEDERDARGGYRSRSYRSYSESESSSYREERYDDGDCCGPEGEAAGFDDLGYLTWPGKTR